MYPNEIRQKLKKSYAQAKHLKAYLLNEPFSMFISFKRLSEKEVEKHFEELSNWVEMLQKSPFEISFTRISYRSLGEQLLPASLEINQEQFLEFLSKKREFQHHLHLIKMSLSRFPRLEPLLQEKPQLLMEYDEVWELLLSVCEHFIAHPQPNCYLRELAIEGIDTKFMERHKKIVDVLLSTLLEKEVVKLSKNGFEKRYGLKYDLPTIRFRILDERCYLSGLSDISLPLNQFKQLDIGCSHVFITENKINGLSFPLMKNSMVIFGLGYGVEVLKEIKWLKSKKLYYWGDIDTHGFAILSQVRGYFSQTESILMGEEVILENQAFSVTELSSKRFLGELHNLTTEEARVFSNLKKNVYGEALRIEQERISFGFLRRFFRVLKSDEN